MSQVSLTPAKANKPIEGKKGMAWITHNRFFVPLLLFILVQALVMLGVFSRSDLSLYDVCYRLKGAENPGEKVVVLAIDDSSISRLGPPAWPRSTHARLLEKLIQAKAVAFDLTFANAQDPKEDETFAQAIANHGRVVLAAKFTFEQDENGEPVQGFEPPLNDLLAGCAGLGFVNTPTDIDQRVRRSSLVDVNTFETPFPSLAIATAMVSQNINYDELELQPGRLTVGNKQIPIDSLNQAMIKYWGPKATFKTISYADVIEGKVAPSYFKDKIVLVGTITPEDHDFLATPYTTSNMVKGGALDTPGVEIHASIVQNFLEGQWYRALDHRFNIFFLLLAGLLTSVLVSGRGPWRGLLGTFFVTAASMALVYCLWNYQHLWLSLAGPLALIFLTYVVVTSTEFIQAELGRRKTKAMFSRYVSPDVVDELMANPDEISLGGKKQVVTIMFTDIRGFTAFSENKDPVNVISRLNEYLTAQTDAILKHGGTLDKYMGDGLMAFFGAPVYYEDHVERAVKVARDIQQRVVELNEKWAKMGEVPLLIACGINTGPVVVGNVGSPERMDYTLIGEDANLASRVEALTKLFETLVLVSERSYELLPEGEVKNSLHYVGEELVKGFTNPIRVYSFTDLNLHFEKSKDKGFK
ncbi:MAG: adenylate/guanylate cyclase domain-containing protein [Syntrophomonadaceae bacterium]|nr:adenylate/guanylate cyclase domain-containing protein [Syntrophomonadaceae bacterium]